MEEPQGFRGNTIRNKNRNFFWAKSNNRWFWGTKPFIKGMKNPVIIRLLCLPYITRPGSTLYLLPQAASETDGSTHPPRIFDSQVDTATLSTKVRSTAPPLLVCISLFDNTLTK